MKSGNVAMLNTLKVLGTGKVDYIEWITLRLDSGQTIRASNVKPEGFMLYGDLCSNTPNAAFMVSAEELVAIEVAWGATTPGVVTDILSAVTYEKNRAEK